MGDTAAMSDAPCWILTDSAAGNQRQALALAAALGFGQSQQWTLSARAPWSWTAPRRLPGARAAFGPAFAHALADPPPLVIGCGRQGALATRLARAQGAKAVQILDPRIDPRHWDAVVAPAHDSLRGSNVVTTLGSLHSVDAGWLADARTAHAHLGELPGPRLLLLLGGPVANAPLDQAWWQQTCSLLSALTSNHASLMISASRRTPDWLRQAALEVLPGMPGPRWLDANGDRNPYPGMLAWADRIVVSPDSVNMVSEACATGANVLVPGLERVAGRHAQFLQALQRQGRIDSATLDPWPTATPLVEVARVATQVRALLKLPLGR